MIPLKDDNPTRHFPIVTVVLIVINVAVYVFQFLLSQEAGQLLVFRYGAIPADLLGNRSSEPLGPPPPVTLLTSMFLHGSPLHVGGNMLYLWIFGNNIEDRMGRIRFLLFYLLCGLGAHAGHILTAPNSVIPTIGASGAIAGVLGAYLLLYPHARVLTLVPLGFFTRLIWVPAIFVLGLWIVVQILNGLPSLGGEAAAGIAWFAHIGGFLAGMVLIWPFLVGREAPPARREWAERW
jgi:membrane associated rhomboid family serine protease